MTRFAGYAAIFDLPDEGGDVIERGAFSRSLAGRSVTDIPLLLQHRSDTIAGRIERIEEDEKGLRVIARLGTDRTGKAVGSLVRKGKLKGLSFGYRVRRAGKKGAYRRLDEVDLVEVSLVARPMQPVARVHAIEE